MKNKKSLFTRIFIGLFGFILIMTGLKNIFYGNQNYSNYWGGIVFAPIAILIGVLVIIITVFRFDSITNSKEQSKKSKRK